MAQNQPRRIIYVDAGKNSNENFQISLYDRDINRTIAIELIDINNSHTAELYGVLNAIVYAKTYQVPNAMILCDNHQAANNEKLKQLATKYKIKITWIPREINIIADKATKQENIKKESEFYILNFIYDTIFDQNSNKEVDNSSTMNETKIVHDTKIIKTIKEAIQENITKDGYAQMGPLGSYLKKKHSSYFGFGTLKVLLRRFPEHFEYKKLENKYDVICIKN